MATRLEQAILWRRLDSPGHDACALWAAAYGWLLKGTAAFVSDELPCHLGYEVRCDASWHTLSASVVGWVGRREVDLAIEAVHGGRWNLNGVEQEAAEGAIDLDLSFTPATNLIQLRRLALEVGDGADAPAAYLHFPELLLDRLEHRYHRISENEYDYRAPRFNYAATLEVSDVCFVTRYPGLWEVEEIG